MVWACELRSLEHMRPTLAQRLSIEARMCVTRGIEALRQHERLWPCVVAVEVDYHMTTYPNIHHFPA